MKAEEEEEEEKEEIHEVGPNSASFQSKPTENHDPFLRLSKEDSGGPNPGCPDGPPHCAQSNMGQGE